ncbi:MAG: glycoside hydrolase family 5 protein, partial [Prolixibacteraceae bacterium]|nr:glycoside hydrolase family 5 protein [Prolixibacteraceae bacterium]
MKTTLVIVFFLLFFSGINSTNAQPVKENGQLEVESTFLVNENGEPIILRGISYGWHNWWP